MEQEEEHDDEPNFDIPQSREEKPEAYPNGPICIYETGVDLYLEPTAEVAAKYDVVLNVASEVRNPFDTSVHAQSSPKDDEQQKTPKSPEPRKIPSEYIHIPWEHNTDIVPDLYRLVKIIDERVQEGKRVLVHCQCGVSRSASLIVAYGLYKNPGMSVQDAYDAVKKRSKWIGPNMNLIMQLQEFRSGLAR
ncbi:DSPc-domain-containing protein, partial [Viridothelium virens]